ncbi:MAG: polysaccharide export protein [bacterium]|nr:polysaccharide export protein [bacterium]
MKNNKLMRYVIPTITLLILLPNMVYADYLLGPNDRVFVAVMTYSETGEYVINNSMSGVMLVDPDGKIYVPLAGGIRVAGLQPDAAAAAVEDGLSDYIKYPEVSIRPTLISSRRVVVLGEVRRPGIYTLNTDETVIEALAYAGGAIHGGLTWNLKVVRGGLDDPQIINVNVDEIINNGDYTQNIQLLPGDIVFVPKTLMSRANDVLRDITPLLGVLNTGTTTIEKFK